MYWYNNGLYYNNVSNIKINRMIEYVYHEYGYIMYVVENMIFDISDIDVIYVGMYICVCDSNVV